MPEHFEKRPRSKKFKESEVDDGSGYQFKKILKKPNAAERRPQVIENQKQQQPHSSGAESLQRRGDGPLTEEDKEKLLALVENDDEVYKKT